MAILEIVKYPASVLLKQTDPVTVFDDSLKQLARDLEETMYAAPGVGLAANQVGIAKRISVVNIFGPERRDGLIVLINPEIIRAEGEEEAEEGCLSIPGVWDKVNRATYVLVKTNTLDGGFIEIEGRGLLARAFQHEIDHLKGIVFIERLSLLKKRILKKKLR